jgi:ribonuclease HII
MPLQFGTDEAGKGPVLGSMFAACVVADPTALPDGVADSKRLSSQRREELAHAVRQRAQAVGVAEVSVATIDDPGTDMNTLTVDAHADAILAAHDTHPLDDAAGMLDAGDTSETRFAARVADRLPYDLDLTAEHRADDSYTIVAAASIVAKVERDAHVDRLADDYQDYADIGSGYPSDPSTTAFLSAYVADHGALPDCARRSWRTSKQALADAEQAGLEDYF